MLHFLLEIIIMTRSTKTRLLLRDKCKVVHSDRLYRPTKYTLYSFLVCDLTGSFPVPLIRKLHCKLTLTFAMQ